MILLFLLSSAFSCCHLSAALIRSYAFESPEKYPMFKLTLSTIIILLLPVSEILIGLTEISIGAAAYFSTITLLKPFLFLGFHSLYV